MSEGTRSQTAPRWPIALGVVLLAWVLVAGIVNDGTVPPLGWLIGLLGVALVIVGVVLRYSAARR